MSTDPDFLPRRGGSNTQQPASGYPRRGHPVDQPDVDDDVSKRGTPATVPTAPPRRPAIASRDVAAQPPRTAIEHRQPDVNKPDPEPEDPDWNLQENLQRFRSLLTAEWPHWGLEHRQDFEDTLVQTIEFLYSAAAKTVAAASVSNSSHRKEPRTPAPTAPAPVVEDEPVPED